MSVASLKDLLLDGFTRARPLLDPPLLGVSRRLGSRGHRGAPAPVTLTTYGVYRSANATVVAGFLDSLPPGTVHHLHALDDVPAALRQRTDARGPGARMPLLRALMEAHPPGPGRYVLVHDDDVSFVGDGGRHFAGLAARAGLDVAQPAHAPGSRYTFYVTAQTPLSTVRQTRFVEVGPVVLLSPEVLPDVVPFPTGYEMGWGLDVEWSRLTRQGRLLGVVDATPVVHHGEVGAAYAAGTEADVRDEALRAAGVDDVLALAGNVGRTWRPWQSVPRWRR